DENLYVQGFSSISIPTDGADATLLLNDIAVGYFAYRTTEADALVRYVVPTVELHVTTPLNHRGTQNEPIGVQDIFDVTFGATVGLGSSSSLGVGVVVPFTGPTPFDIEAQAFLNYRF